MYYICNSWINIKHIIPVAQTSGQCNVWQYLAGSLDFLGIEGKTRTPTEKKMKKLMKKQETQFNASSMQKDILQHIRAGRWNGNGNYHNIIFRYNVYVPQVERNIATHLN